MGRNLPAVLVFALAACLFPPDAVSQQLQEDGGDGSACTYACGCSEAACTCSRNGGKGGSCRTDGDICTVFKCTGGIMLDGGALAYAADGSLVLMRAEAGDTTGFGSDPLVIQAVRWNLAAPGHLVGTTCGDVVVSEFFDPEAAAGFRERARLITL